MKNICFLLFLVAAVSVFFYVQNPRTHEPISSVIGEQDHPDAALRFRYEMLSGNQDNSDLIQLRQNAVSFTDRMIKAERRLKKSFTEPSWSPVGPGNIGGRIRSILIHPAHSDTMLIGGVAGGVWKRTDGGASWTPTMDAINFIAISSMVIDPLNENVVYAGTGEGWGNLDAVYGGGIYKSTNFGDTWTQLASTAGSSNFRDVLKLAADPSGNIYAATKDYVFKYGLGTYTASGGLFKSTNGGTSWNAIHSLTFSTNYFNPCDVIPISSSTILYAVNVNSSTLGGIYRTTDGGTNWTLISSGLPSTNYRRIALTQDPATANTVYAVFESTDLTAAGDAGLRGIFKSTDAGATWTQLTSPPKIASTGSKSYLSSQGWYDNVISVDPFDANTLYVGGVDMMKSTDGGSSWSHATYWHAYYGSPVVHADHHAIVFNKNIANTLYSGNDGGIYRTTDNGASWTSLNNGLEITQFYSGAVYKNGSTYHGGTQDNGHLKYDEAGTDWTAVYGGDGGYSAQDQTNSDVMYEEYVYLSMSKSTDGGSSWSTCISGLTDANNSSNSLFIAPFAMNPENSAVLAAGSNKVWITDNSAGSWTQSSNVLSASNKVTSVAVVNTSANYLGFAGTTDGKIFICTSLNPASGIDTWTNISPVGNNTGWVRRIVVDLGNKNNIYAVYGGYNTSGTLQSRHVWNSTDQGTNWTDVSGNLPNVPVHTLVIDPNTSSTLYAGTETGVYRTTDNGTTWSALNSGMPSYVPVDELVVQNDTKSLFAFTHGRGVWKLDNVLPVELTEFFALTKNSSVELGWTTATENDNYGFEIEKAFASNQWRKIGFVEGVGTSNSPRRYTFTDQSPLNGTNTYRLKQIDRNGKMHYSPIAEAVMPLKFALSQNFPNPFNPATAITFSIPAASYVTLKIFNSVGKEVSSIVSHEYAAGIYTVTWNAEGYASGVYFYRLQAGKYIETKKLMLLK